MQNQSNPTFELENNALKAENFNLKQSIEGLNAQLDACKQMLNENQNTSMVIRTNMFYFQKKLKESEDKNTELQTKLDIALDVNKVKDKENAINKVSK